MASLCLLALVCAIGDFSQRPERSAKVAMAWTCWMPTISPLRPDLLPEAVTDVIQDHFAANRSVQDWEAGECSSRRIPCEAGTIDIFAPGCSADLRGKLRSQICFNINYIESEYNALVSAATYQKLATNIEKAVDA